MATIRVLIADDSPFIRHLYTDFIDSDPELELAGKAKTGQEALDLIKTTKPHVVTLDYEMPVLNGLQALKRIMAEHPLPVIMISSHTRKGARVTLDALNIGAFDFLTKTEGKSPLHLYELREDFLHKVKVAAREFTPRKAIQPQSDSQQLKPNWKPMNTSKPNLLIIGTSSGGPRALQEIIPSFPTDIDSAMIIVQHMPKGFTASLAQRLDRDSPYKVKEAANGDLLEEGLALVAPGDFHLLVDTDRRIILNKKAPLWGVRPAVDYTLQTAAPIFKENALGVILTGMGRDGTQGLLAVKEHGGRTIVEAEETCTVFGMPRSAILADAADMVLPLHEIPAFITSMYREEAGHGH